MDYGYGLGLGPPVAGDFGVTSASGKRGAFKTTYGHGSTMHYGTDFGTPRGTQALASLSGVVVRVKNDPKGYGNYVAIYDPQRKITVQYAHMDSIDVRPGQRVTMGQPIGKTGATGNVSGPHLDYTVVHNGQYVSHTGHKFGSAANKPWLVQGHVESGSNYAGDTGGVAPMTQPAPAAVKQAAIALPEQSPALPEDKGVAAFLTNYGRENGKTAAQQPQYNSDIDWFGAPLV